MSEPLRAGRDWLVFLSSQMLSLGEELAALLRSGVTSTVRSQWPVSRNVPRACLAERDVSLLEQIRRLVCWVIFLPAHPGERA